MIVVGTDVDLERLRYAVLEPVPTCDNVSPTSRCEHRLAPGAEMYSDGLACFAHCIGTGNAHTVPVTRGRRAACELSRARRVNVVLANVKRTVSGRYHAFKQSKYAAPSRRSPIPIQPGDFVWPQCCRV